MARRRRRMRSPPTRGSGPLSRIGQREGVISRIRERRKQKRQPPGRRQRSPPADLVRRRRARETPEEVVAQFRSRFPDLNIPNPGPEPQPLEGALEPRSIELAGVVWALRTADGIGKKYGETPEEEDTITRNVIPGLLNSRETWERRTAAGIRQFVEEIIARET